ncbi:histone deacetylase HDT1 [Artemisia annua]|uniref:Histone deacetylase HDT1 n=1 Tax=Artemisia annua TaxID=35608 RepID=A0A2U1P1E6_ARTAN|nr:histone deacetylase HDT1 [Artemisia annua]
MVQEECLEGVIAEENEANEMNEETENVELCHAIFDPGKDGDSVKVESIVGPTVESLSESVTSLTSVLDGISQRLADMQVQQNLFQQEQARSRSGEGTSTGVGTNNGVGRQTTQTMECLEGVIAEENEANEVNEETENVELCHAIFDPGKDGDSVKVESIVGVEVKSGETFEVVLGDDKVLLLSLACLGETKKNKSESVCLHINVEGKKLVLGTLHSERLPQQLLHLVLDKTFTISHNWKNGSVYFYGYQPSESEAIRLPTPNGKQESKKEVKETKKEEKSLAAYKKDAKQGVSKDMSDDSDDGSDEEEETPKTPQSGKKRQNESIKTPPTDKKARMTPPQKTDGKKAAVHVATPHPSKKPDAKTAGNESNQKSPASAADGAHSCQSCNREPWKLLSFIGIKEYLRTLIKPLASQPKFCG